MPPTPSAPGSVRPAAVVNAEIRALWERVGGQLPTEDRDTYHRLLIEWATAVHRERLAAAA